MSFYCDHCGLKNNEIQPAGEIQEQGATHTLKATKDADLERQIIKSDKAVVRLEELDVEIPAGRGRLTNIEGILSEVLVGLEAGQKQRKEVEPEVYEKIDVIVKDLTKTLNGAAFPFTISMDDPSGNSTIEPLPDDDRSKLIHKQYPRTSAQNETLGLAATDGQNNGVAQNEEGEMTGDSMDDVDILEGKTYQLPVQCPGCNNSAQVLMQMVNIPHFKQAVISTTSCNHCNYHTSDCKTGGEIPDMGKRITLKVESPNDLKRDILKSETCELRIPELELETGTMGGRFTTVEGLLTQIRDAMKDSIFDDEVHDSMRRDDAEKWKSLIAKLDDALEAKTPFSIIMTDPLGGSYCQELSEEPDQDPQIVKEDYERTEEEEEHLGLADMKTHLNEDGEYVKEPRRDVGKAEAKAKALETEEGELEGIDEI